MSKSENMEVRELNLEEMDKVVGGASNLAPREGFIIYKIQTGDNQLSICKKFRCAESQLFTWNPQIMDWDSLRAGLEIYIKS